MSDPGREEPPREAGDLGHFRAGGPAGGLGLWLGSTVAATVAATWLPRTLAAWERGFDVTARGYAGDLAWALLLTLGLLWIRRAWLRGVLVCLWLLLHWAAYEHVRALDAPLALHHAGFLLDPVFLAGSVIRPSRPWLLLGVLVLVVAGVWRSPPSRSRHRRRAAVALLAAAATLGLALALGSLLGESPSSGWRGRSTVGAALSSVLRLGPSVPTASTAPDVLLPVDLSGEPWLAAPSPSPSPSAVPSAPDVVQLVLEGVSSSYLPSVREVAGSVDPGLDMPGLDAVARRHPTAVQLLNQQRQTHRGLWSILCGRPPRPSTASALFSEVALSGRSPRPPCLPAVLAKHGYRTVFSQASPLSFMHKDMTLPLLGFETVEKLGAPTDVEPLAESVWGVDDVTFLRRVRQRIGELRQADAPYFLTVLTSGSHHPYTVPGEASLPAAMAHLDRAVAELMAGLAADGVLDDTLVILTADESAGAVGDVRKRRDEARGTEAVDGDRETTAGSIELAQNHGLAILSLPDDRAASSDPAWLRTPFLQSDLALSVLDFLGPEFLADDDASGLGGRSLFRSYADDRPLAFANTYYLWIAEYLPGEAVVLCGETGADCRRLEVDGGPFRLTGATRPVETPERLRRWLGLDPADTTGRAGSVPLTSQTSFVLEDGAPGTLVFGGQYLELPRGETLEVAFEASVETRSGGVEGADPASGWLHLLHDLTSQNLRQRPAEFPALAPGDRVALRYRLTPPETVRGLGINLAAHVLTGGPLVLRVDAASFRILSAEESENSGVQNVAPRIDILERQVTRQRDPEPVRYDLRPVAADTAACGRRDESATTTVWRFENCAAGELLAGPSHYLAPGSRLSVRWHLRGVVGSVTLHGLVGSKDPPLVYGQTDTVTLDEGEERVLELETTVEPTLEKSLAALFLVEGGDHAIFEVERVAMVVQPP